MASRSEDKWTPKETEFDLDPDTSRLTRATRDGGIDAEILQLIDLQLRARRRRHWLRAASCPQNLGTKAIRRNSAAMMRDYALDLTQVRSRIFRPVYSERLHTNGPIS